MWLSPKRVGIIGKKPGHRPPEVKATLVMATLSTFFVYLSL